MNARAKFYEDAYDKAVEERDEARKECKRLRSFVVAILAGTDANDDETRWLSTWVQHELADAGINPEELNQDD